MDSSTNSLGTDIYDEVYEGNEPYVFISYAHGDKEKYNEIVDLLRSHKVRFWYDNDLHSGDDWLKIISEHVKKATVFLLLLSEKSANSKYVKDELNYAKNNNIPIHILQLEDFEIPSDVEMMIGRIHRIMAEGDYKKGLIRSLPEKVFYVADASPEESEHPDPSEKTNTPKNNSKNFLKRLYNDKVSLYRVMLFVTSVLLMAVSIVILWKTGYINKFISLFNPSADTAYSEKASFPDLLDFSNGFAKIVSDETDNEENVRKIIYEFRTEKYTKIISEYISLIMRDYNYSTIHQDSENLWYTFKYNGNNSVDGFKLTFDSQEHNDINLSLRLYNEDNKFYLRIFVNAEIEMESTEKRTSLAWTHIPDFSKYAAIGPEKKTITNRGKYSYIFSFEKNSYSFDYVQKIATDYITLLTTSYDFEKSGGKALGSNLDWFYWFKYTGTNAITTYQETLNYDETKLSDYSLSIRIYEENDTIIVRILTAPEIAFVDNGERY